MLHFSVLGMLKYSIGWRPQKDPIETLGGFRSGALAQVKLLGSALARSKGLDENEVTSQFFGRLSLCLMRGNAIMMSSRSPDQDIPVPEIDGVL